MKPVLMEVLGDSCWTYAYKRSVAHDRNYRMKNTTGRFGRLSWQSYSKSDGETEMGILCLTKGPFIGNGIRIGHEETPLDDFNQNILSPLHREVLNNIHPEPETFAELIKSIWT